MKIIATSDLHGFLPKIPPCDLLLIAGDITPRKEHRVKKQRQWLRDHFFPWLKEQPAQRTFFVAGNHDVALEDTVWVKSLSDSYLYLEEKSYRGIKIWGNPYALHGAGYAFQESAPKIKKLFRNIPDDLDIIVSHAPMRGILDFDHGIPGIKGIVTNSRASLFLSGHIHNAFGFETLDDLLCLNASLCSTRKVPDHPLWEIDWGQQGVRSFRTLFVEVDDSAVPLAVRYGKKRL